MGINFPASALALSLLAASWTCFCPAAPAQDSSEWMQKVGTLNVEGADTVLKQLQNGLYKAKNFADFSEINKSLEARSFGLESNLTAADRKQINDVIEQLVLLIKATDASNESIRCQALVARYFVTVKANDKGEFHYDRALKRSQRSWRGTGLQQHNSIPQPAPAAELENGCKTALALLYINKGKIEAAEKFYREINGSWQDLSAGEKEKYIRQTPPFGTFHPGQAAMASRLGQAYEKAGKNDMALKHYDDLRAFETFVLDNGYLDPRSSIVPAVYFPAEKPTPLQIDFDPIVGQLPATETLMAPYLRFGAAHPDLVNPTELGRIKEQMQLAFERRRSRAHSKSNFSCRSKEIALLDNLSTQPQSSLQQLRAEINKRKAQDPNDPIVAYSANAIGMRLTNNGLSGEAEKFLKESIAIRERQGPAGRFALGASLNSLGLVYLEEGKLAQARPILERACRLRQGDPVDQYAATKAEVALGRLLAAEGKTTAAENQLKKAASLLKSATQATISSDPKTFDASKETMEIYTERKAVKSAEQKSGRMYYCLAQVELATLYIKQNKLDQAEDLLKPLQSLLAHTTDLSLEARLNEKLGRICMGRGDLKGAEAKLGLARTALKEHRAEGLAAQDIGQALSQLQAKRSLLQPGE